MRRFRPPCDTRGIHRGGPIRSFLRLGMTSVEPPSNAQVTMLPRLHRHLPYTAPDMAYTVTVGDFEGPFDLLLQLIAQRRVDVYDVALADITDDYLAVVRTMDTVDLEATTEFLIIAATLVELKAARLLPTEEPEIDEFAVDARDLLYARL